jgi:hypothetical protein
MHDMVHHIDAARALYYWAEPNMPIIASKAIDAMSFALANSRRFLKAMRQMGASPHHTSYIYSRMAAAEAAIPAQRVVLQSSQLVMDVEFSRQSFSTQPQLGKVWPGSKGGKHLQNTDEVLIWQCESAGS